MEVEINGTPVALRDKYPTREFDDLRRSFVKITVETPWLQRAQALCRFIESWGFAGDPQDPEVWGDLDIFSEMMAIEVVIADMILVKVQQAKNLASGSTTT